MAESRLFIVVSSDYDDLVAKGVAGMLAERDEGGFFSEVVSLHPLAKRSREIEISPNHVLVELGTDWLPGGANWRLLRMLYSPLYLWRAVRTSCRIAREMRATHVRGTDPFLAGLIAWLSARSAEAAFIISLHADYRRHENRDVVARMPFSDRVARFLLGRTDLIAPISAFLASSLEEQRISREKFAIISHGTDLELFGRAEHEDVRRRFGIAPDAVIVLYVNRLSKQKYCLDALEVAARVHGQNLCFVFCGDGPERPEMEARVRADPRLAGRVMFLGFQSRETVAALASEATVGMVLLAGLGLIELASAGLPTVVYDVEWQTELIEDGVTGRVVPLGDTEAAADAVEALCRRPEEARRLGAAARQRVVAEFSRDAAQRRRIRAYRRAAERRAALAR